MNLIDKVTDLQKQIAEAKRKKIPRFTIPIIESLDERGEEMIAALAHIHTGDAEILGELVDYLDASRGNSDSPEYEAAEISCLSRLLSMCQEAEKDD